MKVHVKGILRKIRVQNRILIEAAGRLILAERLKEFGG